MEARPSLNGYAVWCRRLESATHEQRLGVIGNCMTGPLPVALLDNPQVGAAVVAQPALPMSFWWSTDADKQSLGLSVDDLQGARGSAAKIYGLRFETDCMSDPAKQHTLRKEFGERFLSGEIPADEYQHDGKPTNAHSTLIGSWKKAGRDWTALPRRARTGSAFSSDGATRESSRTLTHPLIGYSALTFLIEADKHIYAATARHRHGTSRS